MTPLTGRNLSAIAGAVLLFGCGVGTVGSHSVEVTVSPSSAAIPMGSSASFTASVANATNLAVAWSVQEAASGGAVTATGLYTAPATAGTYHIVATSEADPTKSGSATVTVTSSAPPPVITSFTASPPSLPAGGGTTTLSWAVTGATSLSIDRGVGTVTGTSKSVGVTATTPFTLTATNANGSTTAQTTVGVASGVGFDLPSGCRYAAMISPVDGETFIEGALDLRFVGVGTDCSRPTNSPPGKGGSADALQFIVDGNPTPVFSMTWDNAEFHYFKGFASVRLAPGEHTIVARAIYTSYSPQTTIDSIPVTITVLAAPNYGQTLSLSGATSLSTVANLVGTPDRRIRVNGNGHAITGSGSTAVNWQYVDFYDVGDRTRTSTSGFDITTSGSVTIQNCRFYSTNPLRLSQSGSATASIRGNLWASSVRQPIGQQPAGYGISFPAVILTGSSSGAKAFAGNNVGAGWVDLSGATNWTVGGDTDADSNVFIGPRVGVYFDGGSATNVTLRRNFSQHIYVGGWSQGGNFELGTSVATSSSVRSLHNVIAGGSWPVRMVGGEFAYNLILMGKEEGAIWLGPSNGVHVHHNVIVGGCNAQFRSCIGQLYGGVARVNNNTIDGRNLVQGGVNPGAVIASTATMTAYSNAVLRIKPGSIKPVSAGGALTADYNLFFDSGSAPYYSDSRTPAHDVAASPQFADVASYTYHYAMRDVWLRVKTPYSILQDYRARYAPQAGSPAIDAGEPGSYGAGNDIGAVGSGASNPSDLFGR